MVGVEERPAREKEGHLPFAVEPYSSLEQVAGQCSGRDGVEQEAGEGLEQRHFAAAVGGAERQAQAVANRPVLFVLVVPGLEPLKMVAVVVVAAAVGPRRNSSGRQLLRRGYLVLTAVVTCLLCLCVSEVV